MGRTAQQTKDLEKAEKAKAQRLKSTTKPGISFEPVLEKIAEELGYAKGLVTRTDKLALVVNEIRRLRNISSAWNTVFSGVDEWLDEKMPATINGSVSKIIGLFQELKALREFKAEVRKILNDTGWTDNTRILALLRKMKITADMYDEDEEDEVDEDADDPDDDDLVDFGVQLRAALGLPQLAAHDRVIRHVKLKGEQLRTSSAFLQRLANMLDVHPDLPQIYRAVQGLKNRDALRGRFFSQIKDKLLQGYGVETEEEAIKHLMNWKEALTEIEERELAGVPSGVEVPSNVGNHVHRKVEEENLRLATINLHSRMIKLGRAITNVFDRHQQEAGVSLIRSMLTEWEKVGIKS